MAYNVAIKLSTPEMVRKAYAEYVKVVQTRWNRLMQAQEAVVEATQDTTLTDAQLLAIIAAAELPSTSPVPLNVGTASSLLSYLREVSRLTVAGVENADFSESIAGVTDSTGAPVNITLQEAFTEMNSTFHSVTVEFAVATGYNLGNDIPSIVASARDVMSSFFTSGYTDVSNSLSAAIDKIRSGLNFNQYVNSMVVDSGIEAVSSGSSDFSQSTSYTFTGASPGSAFSFKTLSDGIVTTVTAAANTVKNILGPIVNAGSQLFNKAVRAVKETLVSPYDVKELNTEASTHTFDGLFAQFTDSITRASFPKLNAKLAKGPLHFDFYAGEVMMFDAFPGSTSSSLSLRTQVKIKSINKDLIAQFDSLRAQHGTGNWPLEQVENLHDQILAGSVSVYNELDVSELDFWKGLLMGSVLMKYSLAKAQREVLGQGGNSIQLWSAAEQTAWDKTSVTNLDFLQLLTQTSPFAGAIQSLRNYSTILTAQMFEGILAEQDASPLDPPFWPYQHDYATWFAPQYGLKSDQENQTAFNNFVSTAIVVAVVAVIAVKSLLVLKRLALTMNLKAQGAAWTATNAAANGELTPTMVRNVSRANFKANIAGWLSGNFTNPVGSVFKAADVSNADVMSLLR